MPRAGRDGVHVSAASGDSPAPAVRRRIAFVTPLHFGADSYVGGGERYPLNLARGVVAADPGVHVDLIAIGDPQRVSIQPRLDLHVLPISAPGDSFLDHVSSAVADALEDVDLVHIHQGFTRSSQVAILVAKFLGKPVALTDHGAGSRAAEQAVRYLQLFDLLVFQSRFAAGCIKGGRRRVTIPGGVDDRFFRPTERPVAREFMMFVGRLLAHKGIDRLICALPRDLPCVVAGRAYDPSYAAYLHALAAGRDVRFVEDADDLELRELYRRAWATVLPSVHRDAWCGVYLAPELMGFSALESMACGTPTLVSPAAALPEFVRDGETGFVCEGLADFAERSVALASGDLDADALGRNARALVETAYSVEIAGERLMAAYNELWQAESGCGS